MHADSSRQGRGQDRSEPLPVGSDAPQPFQQAPEESLLGIVVAIADADSPAWRQILAARNRNRKRAVAKVVCFKVSALASS